MDLTDAMSNSDFLAELNEFSNLGKGPETMKVPYAKKWQKEIDKLRLIAFDCDLREELKWGKPCFTEVDPIVWTKFRPFLDGVAG